MKDCLFCQLVNDKIPTTVVHEDEEFKVVLDAFPISRGHCLVIPKKHYKDLFDIPDDVLGRAIVLAKETAHRLRDQLDNCTGVNIVQNNGVSAGQTVFHFHIHIIPRYGEPVEEINWQTVTFDEEIKTVLENLW